MAQKSILKALITYGLNPNDWSIQSLRSEGLVKTIWFRSNSNQGWALKGQLQDLGFRLNLLDLELIEA